MKISAVPSVVNSMTVATQHSPETSQVISPKQELSIPDNTETKTPEATQPLSPQFAELAKRRRALQLKERALADREKALTNNGTGSDVVDIARLRSQPLNVLQEAGIMGDAFYNQMTEHLMGNGSLAEKAAREAEIDARVKDAVNRQFQEQQTLTRQQTLTEIRRNVEQHLSSNADRFKLVKAERLIPEVMELIERTYDEENRLMPEEEALEEIEGFLREKYQRLNSLYEPQQPSQPQPQPQQQIGMRTLRNKDTASISVSRRARALAAWNNSR